MADAGVPVIVFKWVDSEFPKQYGVLKKCLTIYNSNKVRTVFLWNENHLSLFAVHSLLRCCYK